MTVAEVLEQVKKLSVEERKELAKRLIDIIDEPPTPPDSKPTEHWGRNLLKLLDEIGPVELVHPEIEDAVEWVETIRRESRQRRLGDWGEQSDEEGLGE